MFTVSPFPHDERMEKEAILADYWDAEFPGWQESESDPERFVSEYDMENDEFETEFNRINLMTMSEFAQYADNLEREREIMRDLEGWF